MNVKNCPRCNRIFIPQGGRKICPVCVQEEEKQYEIVREYLRENPGAPVLIVIQETGVDEDTILQFIKEGRLEAGSIQGAELHCESCGTAITKGRFCGKCQDELARDLQRAAGLSQPKAPERETKGRAKDKFFTADFD
ncbi:flagellar protein [Heliobacillus mobilis]|uniref:Flagellar protein n=1 Tax=Heliobacterium mobile TaxID=28064 RepID=A0A6I3SLU4_HELMO|nr:TIGR03826 family flagellar region protein [Heliobacterium mobile]MTV49923.1 flagellar protein [Heliobacterium mobile]